MALAMLGAAALLVLWMFMRGGLRMSKSQAINILAVMVVVGVVAGAAWFKSQRAQTPAEGSGASGNPPLVAQPTAGPAETVVDGELCREPVPTSRPGVAQTAEGATAQPIEDKLPRLVDLGADKCIPCKKMAPILEQLREEYKGRLDVEFIDVWKDPGAARQYGIRVIPTQILYDGEGGEVWRHQGFISKDNLKTVFAQKAGVR